MVAPKLQHYFCSHIVCVLTLHPLKNVLAKPNVAGRQAHIAIELEEYDINYMPWISIQSQALSNFVVEFSDSSKVTSNENLDKVYGVGVK